jgi:ankyrin repeat protein
LVAKGAKINRTDRWGNSSLDDAHRGKHTEVLKYLRQHGARFGDAANQIHKLIEAAGTGNIEVARTILEFGSALDINQGDYDKRTALHLACSEGRLKMVELLLSQEGIDIDVLDRWGNKPIDDAKRAKYNSEKIIELLKNRGAKSDNWFWPFSQRKTSSLDTKGDNNQTSVGTAFYWPPEMFVKGAVPTPAIDMWAAGVISYMVLTGT